LVQQILGTFIAQLYGITDTCAMKGTWFVVNIVITQILTIFIIIILFIEKDKKMMIKKIMMMKKQVKWNKWRMN
jgi:hypothetical protein